MKIDMLNQQDLDERGQITPHSHYGRRLTDLARQANVIVETGTWRGLGSTYCLYLGMERPEQRLYTVELMKVQHEEAKSYYDDARIKFINGTLVLPDEVPPFDYPDPEFRKYYDFEVDVNRTAPYVLDLLPEKIDLLLLDSGSWTGEVEFRKLGHRALVVALDDTNHFREVKHYKTRRKMIDEGWRILDDELNERNGWAIFEKPAI